VSFNEMKDSDEAGGHTSHEVKIPAPAEQVVTPEAAVERSASAQRSATPEGGSLQGWHYTSANPPRRIDLSVAPALVADDKNFVWFDLADYGTDDLSAAADTLGIHQAAMRSALSAWKRPRLDVFEDQFFVSATIPVLDFHAHHIEARELDIFVGHNYLVSAHKAALPFAEAILSRAQQDVQLLDNDSAFLLYIFLDEVLVYYDQIYEQLQEAIATLEDRALRTVSEDYLRELQSFK
jgi:Mg2+ and Co2+ transporter CorA